MATDKKHIAVYLDKAVEDALTAFCTANGMESKKGPMYSAAVNKALSEFFKVENNTPDDESGNIPDTTDNTVTAHLIMNHNLIEESLQERLKESRESAHSLQKLYTQACWQVNDWMDRFKSLEEKLEATDALVVFKNNKIASVSAQLAAEEQIIAEAGKEIESLKSELTVAVTARKSELPEPAELLNQLKSQRKSSKSTLADIEAILEILDK